MPKLTGTFDIDAWEPGTVDDAPGGPQLGRARVVKTFHGDLEGGTSVTEILTAATADESLMAYYGVERFTGAVDGREGTFILLHEATATPESQSLTWRIMPGTGTGDLTGITGEGTIDPGSGEHVFTLDYVL